MSEQMYTMLLRKNFTFVASSRHEAIAEARRVLVELLQDGWFWDADFEVVQVADIEGRPSYNKTGENDA